MPLNSAFDRNFETAPRNRRIKPAKHNHPREAVRRFCKFCKDKQHNKTPHGPMGCMAVIGPEPRDFVCRCIQRRSR